MILRNSETCLVNLDAYDRDKYASVIERSPVLQEMKKKGEEIFPSFPSLQRDLWAGLYKYDPEIKKHTPPDLRMNQEILKNVYSLPEFQGLREITRLDNLASALGILSVEDKVQNVIGSCLTRNKEKAEALKNAVQKAEKSRLKEEALQKKLNELMKQLKQHQQQQQQQQEQQQDQGNQGQQGQSSSEQLNNEQQQREQGNQGQQGQNSIGDETTEKLQQMIEQLQQSLSSQQAKSQQATQEAETVANDIASQVSNLMSKNKDALAAAIGEATKETLNDKQNIMLMQGGGYSNIGSGQESDADVAACLEIAKTLKRNPDIKKVIQIAGKMKKIAFSKKKDKVLSMSRQKVENGNNIERLIPNELLLFNTPDTKQYFMKRFSESQCLQYAQKTKDKSGKGPVVCCIDTSGSMDDRLNTEKKCEWAKAVAYALFSIAVRDKRPFNLIEFESCVITNHQIKKGEAEKIMGLLTPKHRGGTNFYEPLNTAMEIISKQHQFKKADIIFITDGYAELSCAFLKEIVEKKRKTKTSIFSIQLDKSESSDTLELFSDTVIRYDGTDEFTTIFEI